MAKRLLGVATLVLLLGLSLLVMPALAVEEEEGPPEHRELPSIEEVGTQSETAQRFVREPYEFPTVFAPMIYPLLIGAVVVVVLVLVLYLKWQPRFAEERKKKTRR